MASGRGLDKCHLYHIFCSPDIQVGVPFSSLVEKAMESKGKELLPKIQEVVEALRQTKPPPLANTDTSNETHSDRGNNSSKLGMDFDLSLPIDLPGLVTSSNPSIVKKEVGSLGNDGKMGRTKTKQMETASVKEVKSGTKLKSLAVDGNGKVISAVKGKEKEIEKPPGIEEGSKEKIKASKLKKIKEETKEKNVQKELGADELKEVSKPEQQKSKAGSIPSESLTSSKGTKKENCIDNNKKSGPEKKQLPSAPRRSARLASLTEDQAKNDNSDLESDGAKELELEEEGGHTSASEQQESIQTMAAKKKKSHKARPPSRKRARQYNIESSSEDSENEVKDRLPLHIKKASPDGSRERKNEPLKSRTEFRKHLRSNEREMVSPAPTKRQRKLSRTGSPASTASNTSSTVVEKSQQDLKQEQTIPSGRDSKSPLKSPTVVVTRFNRHVKPNRWYYPFEEAGSSNGEEESQKSDFEDNKEDISSDSDVEEKQTIAKCKHLNKNPKKDNER